MENQDYYKTLGIEKTATQDEIRSAYKKLAKQWHPDLQQNKSEAEKKAAEEKFKQVNAAYETLSDPEKRKMYDSGGPGAFQQGFSGNPEDLFSSFASRFSGFGDFMSSHGFGFQEFVHPTKHEFVEKNGADLKFKVSISLKDAIFGAKKKIMVPTMAECKECHGTGTKAGASKKQCKTCGGRGTVQHMSAVGGFAVNVVEMECPNCHGSGISPDSVCKACNGEGRVQKNTVVEIAVPPGANTDKNYWGNAKYCIQGAGVCGVQGGAPGNLYIIFSEIPDKLFERSPVNVHNLRTTVKVNPLVAITGGTIDVYTPGGLKKCKIPELTPHGKVFKIKNTWTQGQNAGDLEVVVEYELPSKLSAKTKKAIGKIIETGEFETQSLKEAAKLFKEFNK